MTQRTPDYGVRGRCRSRLRRGLTLVELVVAGVVAALLIGAASAAIGRVIDIRTRVRDSEAAGAAAHMAVRMVGLDLSGLVRDPDPRQTLLRIQDDATAPEGEIERDELTLISRGVRPVRSAEESPDAGIYEVQYRVQSDAVHEGVLWRRSDMLPDEEVLGGGVATPLAVRIVSLQAEAFDGVNWLESWDSDRQGLPFAVRVTCRARQTQSDALVTARVTIAVDRTPLPMTHDQLTVFDEAIRLRETDGYAEEELNLFGGAANGFLPPPGDGSDDE